MHNTNIAVNISSNNEQIQAVIQTDINCDDKLLQGFRSYIINLHL